MNTHDVLAYAVAQEAVRRLRDGAGPWNTLFSSNAYITASRAWPVPDFVLVDSGNELTIAAEFKPPLQSKREYLTGLGQAIAYSKDFHYALLVLPDIADDGYQIANHVVDVLRQGTLEHVPVGVLSYDPARFSPLSPSFTEAHFFSPRTTAPASLAHLDNSFYAKWREMSPQEALLYLSFCYDEMRSPSSHTGTIRDRAFEHLWRDIQEGKVSHWAGGTRHYAIGLKTGVNKNYRNFFFHIGWIEADGALTREGLEALHIGTLYGSSSRPFLDTIATAALTTGKHLILFNAISEFQDSLGGSFPEEKVWLDQLEEYLEMKGLLKRNPERGAAAERGSARQFLKAEKQFWKNLELIVPRKNRVFHPGRGFIFNWSRITDLLQTVR
ncbi:MAG: hypothetical protein CVU34_17290 [Betaproteobacteria bacterium HGW-Betaproteobacteria-7]|jgi:hypothetical protein|uniref:Uncharacterized protein n=1 Tax=Candidatus Anoxymicrobium japonicum TaxID=2013648 RepID=A0A2N3G461_9ACTN|nr:MAG: hypothetical protein CVU34_17290 [Betaproteobacteria bacterium HGW-Betaproteobacteria-7]PKQ27503.1 MAG: hypothetical protein CVT63_07650 [Candidatus Anoxymicrobium japonicum]